MNQVHGDHVEFVDAARAEAFDATDALVTTTPGLALAVVTADCVPVLMADAEAGVLGAAHAGRVGAANGVVLRTLEAMLAAGARAPDVSVLLGPAVSGANYEVPEKFGPVGVHHDIQTSDANRPVGASRRWLNNAGSVTVHRGSMPMALTPAARSWRAIPARRSSAGAPLPVVVRLPGRRASTSAAISSGTS